MEITFVIEDGTGLADATSYITIDEMKQYWFNLGRDFDSLSDSDIERLLNQSTSYIDSNYSFPGYRATSIQGLEWIRSGAYYTDGYEIDEDVIPPEVKKAVAEMAYLLNDGETPEAIISKSGKVIAESSQVDVIKESFKYEEGSILYSDIYTSVDNILYRLTGGVSNNFVIKLIMTGGESP